MQIYLSFINCQHLPIKIYFPGNYFINHQAGSAFFKHARCRIMIIFADSWKDYEFSQSIPALGITGDFDTGDHPSFQFQKIPEGLFHQRQVSGRAETTDPQAVAAEAYPGHDPENACHSQPCSGVFTTIYSC
jgi:hypothetical protein